MMAAHCSELIAPVPESVSRSMNMSSAFIRKQIVARFFQRSFSRSSREMRRMVLSL
jgi:hypothetical protein